MPPPRSNHRGPHRRGSESCTRSEPFSLEIWRPSSTALGRAREVASSERPRIRRTVALQSHRRSCSPFNRASRNARAICRSRDEASSVTSSVTSLVTSVSRSRVVRKGCSYLESPAYLDVALVRHRSSFVVGRWTRLARTLESLAHAPRHARARGVEHDDELA